MNRRTSILVAILLIAGTAGAQPTDAPSPAAEPTPPADAQPTPAPAAGAAPADGVAPADVAAEEAPVEEDDADVVTFLMRCSGCHTVGGGAMKGPDLIKASQWPETTLGPAIKRMEKHVGALSDGDVATLTALLRHPELQPRLEAQRKRTMAAMQASLEPPNAELGRKLFTGEVPFGKGGLACASCHRADDTGGSFAPDLTRLALSMDEIGMMSAFEEANFPVMRAAYADRPVTKQEALHLAAFFTGIKDQKPTPASLPLIFPLGVVIALGALGLLFFFYGRRNTAGVRARLVQAAARR